MSPSATYKIINTHPNATGYHPGIQVKIYSNFFIFYSPSYHANCFNEPLQCFFEFSLVVIYSCNVYYSWLLQKVWLEFEIDKIVLLGWSEDDQYKYENRIDQRS